MAKYKYKKEDKLNKDYVRCELCHEKGIDKRFHSIKWSHTEHIHGVSIKDYKKKFPDARLLSDAYNEKRSTSKSAMIKRHGKDKGTKKYEEYIKRQAYTNTLEYFIEKYGKEEGTKKYEDKLNNQGKRFKNANFNEKIKLENKYRLRQAYTNTLEYFIEKYGKEEGNEKYKEINIKKSHTYEGMLSRNNGNHEITSKQYLAYCKKMAKLRKNNSNGSSKLADELFLDLYNKIKLNKKFTKIFTQSVNQEWFIVKSKNKIKQVFYLDFFVKDTGKVIEFNGDYWHCNPDRYKSTDIVNYPNNKKMLVSDVWEKDKNKLNEIKEIPYITDVLVIWESELKNYEKLLKKCIDYLTN